MRGIPVCTATTHFLGENGSLQLNRSIKGLEGQLKIRVMAGDFNATLTALKRLESRPTFVFRIDRCPDYTD
jgi:hypothetical protein